MGRNNYSEQDYFFKMSGQASEAGRILDGNIQIVYSHEKYIQTEKELFDLINDDYERGRWSKLADTFEKWLVSFNISTNTEWLDHLRNRNIPSDERKDIAAAFINCIQSGVYEKYDLPQTEEEFEFYRVKQQAQNGNVQAMFELSDMYLHGYGCFRDEQDAFIWLTKAARAGHFEAKRKLKELKRSREKRSIKSTKNKRDLEEEKRLQEEKKRLQEEKLATEKYEREVTNNPNYWLKLGNDRRKSEKYDDAIYYYGEAIKLGSREAERNLKELERELKISDYIKHGNNLRSEANYSGSIEYYEKAIKLGSREAETALKETQQEQIQAWINKGSGYEKRRAYNEAVEYYKKAAEVGNLEAISALADICNFKLRNETEAFRWYKKAAELGDPRCMYNTGVYYEYGNGTEKDLVKAFEWIQKSANAHFVQAMCKLGDYYLVGVGTDKDVTKANQWYKKAIEAGTDNVLVIRNLGKHYLNGIGIEKDHNKALELLMKAAEGEDIVSMTLIGDMYYVGNGVEQDYTKAFYWTSKAAEKNDSSSLYNLGLMYYKGHGIEKNYIKAIKCYQKACDLGHKEAKKNLEDLISKILNSNDANEVMELANFEDERGNFEVSAGYYKKAVEIGGVKSMLKLARKYNLGEGVKCDQRLALDWFMKAVKEDSDEVKNLIKNDTISGDNSEAKFNWSELLKSVLVGTSRMKALENLDKKNNVALAKELEQTKKSFYTTMKFIAVIALLLIVNNFLIPKEEPKQQQLQAETQVTQDQVKPEANENNEKKESGLETSSKKEEQLEEINADKEPIQSQNQKPAVSPSLGENWIKDTSNNIYLFNPTPNEGESIKWSGGFVQDGDFRFADGAGTTTWYLNGEIVQVDEGTFEHGQRHGKFKHTFKNGSIDYSNWNHGEEIALNNAPTSSAENEARQAFINYHRAITAENYNEAYSMLTEEQKQRVGDFRKYASGYIDTVSSEVSDISKISVSDNSVTFNYRLKARDWFSDSDKIKVQIFDGQVTLIKIDNRWYINNAKSSKVNEWYE